AAQKLGETDVPVDYQHYDTEAAEWADLIADNRIAELADVDETLLKDLIQEIDTGELDLELTGFSEDELERLLTVVPGEDALDEATRKALLRRRVRIAWDRFKVFHACVGDQIFCMDRLN